MPQPSQSRGGFLPFGFAQMRDTVTAIAFPIALTVVLPFRSEVGLDNLSLATRFIMAFILYLLDMFTGVHVSLLGGVQGSGTGLLTYYALGFLALGLWQRYHRWREIRSGTKWVHTGSLGVSHLEFLPIRQDRIYRNIDPGIAFMCGLALKNLGMTGLGLWVMFAALCWRIAEEQVYQAGLKQFFAEGNALLEARMRGQVIRRMHEAADARSLSRRETGGVPTGIDSALAAVIAQRRKDAVETNDGKREGIYQ